VEQVFQHLSVKGDDGFAGATLVYRGYDGGRGLGDRLAKTPASLIRWTFRAPGPGLPGHDADEHDSLGP
jgi:hypothetical protein